MMSPVGPNRLVLRGVGESSDEEIPLLTPRRLAKRLLEAGLAGSGLAEHFIRRDTSSIAILAYHNVVPHGESAVGDRSAHVSQDLFGRQLDLLDETHDVVSLDSIIEDSEVRTGRARVIITFDDAYTGAVTAGFEELEKRGLPATMFVPPGLLGGEGFWWDRIVDTPEGSLDYAFRKFAVETLQGRQEEVIRWAKSNSLVPSDLPAHARPAAAITLLAAAGSADVDLAPHTWSHPNLGVIPEAEALDEIQRSREWLSETGNRWVDWLAYPYGLWSDAAASMVGNEMAGGLMILGGLARRNDRWRGDRALLPRIIVPSGLSVEGLLLRLAGLIT